VTVWTELSCWVQVTFVRGVTASWVGEKAKFPIITAAVTGPLGADTEPQAVRARTEATSSCFT
jgi:hypothetical protein